VRFFRLSYTLVTREATAYVQAVTFDFFLRRGAQMATVATEKNSGVSSGRNEAEASSGSRRRPWLWVLVIGAMAAGVYGYRNRSQAPAATANQKQASAASVPVIAAAVESRDVPVYLRGLGSVTAFNTVTVKSRVDGQILQVAFREGQFVKEGDLLVQIDPRPFQVALDQAQGQLAKDEAQLISAKLDLARDQKLVQEGVFSQQQYDQQTAAVDRLKGRSNPTRRRSTTRSCS
jgi:multidrug efflux system membrane fusion protein